jgi:hypothetical protein
MCVKIGWGAFWSQSYLQKGKTRSRGHSPVVALLPSNNEVLGSTPQYYNK